MAAQRRRQRRLFVLPVVMGLITAAAFLIRGQAQTGSFSPSPDVATTSPLEASGLIQARQVSVASELGGRVAQLLIQEGERVAATEPVVQLDTTMVDAEIAVAQATVNAAQAGLRQAEAGARPGEVAVAEGELAQAEAAYLAAQQAVSDTAALVTTPQDLDLQIAVLRDQIQAARAQEAQAIAQKDAVEVVKGVVDDAWEKYDGGGRHEFTVADGDIEDLVEDVLPDPVVEQLPEDWRSDVPSLGDRTITYGDYKLALQDGNYRLSVFKDITFPLEATQIPNQWWQAWVGVNAATATVEAMEARLAQLGARRAHPQSLIAQRDEAAALSARLASQVAMAEAQVHALRAGLTPEELAVIKAQVDQAQAALDALHEKRDLLTLTAPITGTVVDLLVYEGEVAAQGAALVAIADLSELTLTVYVPETRLGDVWLDQPVEVTVDSSPGRVFTGSVSFIAERAEFTPRNVATVEERQNLVFAVDIRLSDAGGALKPGMPADVRFATGAGSEP